MPNLANLSDLAHLDPKDTLHVCRAYAGALVVGMTRQPPAFDPGVERDRESKPRENEIGRVEQSVAHAFAIAERRAVEDATRDVGAIRVLREVRLPLVAAGLLLYLLSVLFLRLPSRG